MPAPSNGQSSRLQLGPEEFISVNLGAISESELKNIARELKRLWQYLDNVHPRAELRATREASGEYYLHLNGRALLYILLFCKDLEPYLPETIKQSSEVPMPPDFLAPD